MGNQLVEMLSRYLNARRKRSCFLAFAGVLSVMMALGVYHVMMKPAISMEIGNPALSAEPNMAVYGEEMVIHVSATAEDEADETVFYMTAIEENAVMTGLTFDRKGKAGITTDDDKTIDFYRVADEDKAGEVSYWFRLKNGESTDFDLTFISLLDEDGDVIYDADVSDADEKDENGNVSESGNRNDETSGLASPSDAEKTEETERAVSETESSETAASKAAASDVVEVVSVATASNASPSNWENAKDGYKPNITDSGLSYVRMYSASDQEYDEAEFAATSALEYDEEGLLLLWLTEEELDVLENGVIEMPEGATSWATVEKESRYSRVVDRYAAALLNDLGDDDGVMTLDGDGTDITAEGVDFGPYITTIKVYKLVNGIWTLGTQFTDGDQVRVDIAYTLPENTVNEVNKDIYYQLPSGVRPLKEESGTVYNYATDGAAIPVGTYVIDTDGVIRISFYEAFADGYSFSGTIRFQGTVSETGAGEDGQIHFGGDGGSITIVPNTEEYDIKTVKTGELSADKKSVNYEILVSTTAGTDPDSTITIKDKFTSSDTATGEYQKSSLKIYKVDKNGGKTDITSQYSSSTTWGTEDGRSTFSITGLPALQEGEKYKVVYTADVTENVSNKDTSLSNAAGAISGNINNWDWETISISKAMLSKWGSYDSSTGLIKWEIEVNTNKANIAGYQLTDILPEGYEFASDVVIKDTDDNWKEYAKIPEDELSDGNLEYTFPNNAPNHTFRVEFYTTAPDKGVTATNTAKLDGGENHYESTGSVPVTNREWGISKDVGDTASQTESGAVYWWNSTVNLPDGALTEFTYEDVIQNATNVSGEDQGVDSHYAIAATLDQEIKENLQLKTEKYGTLGYENAYVTFEIVYYGMDENGNYVTISAENTSAHVKKFTINVKPKDGTTVTGTNLSLKYSTVADYSNMTGGDTWTFKNTASIPGHSDDASQKYTKPKTIEKQGGVINGSTISYGDNVTIDYEQGKLYYRLFLRTELNQNDEIKVTDTLPEGLVFDESSFQVLLINKYGAQATSLTSETSWTIVYDLSGNQKPVFAFDKLENGATKATITIEGGYNKPEINLSKGTEFIITYEASFSGDSFWDDLKNESLVYTNKAEWGPNSAEEETTVKRETEKVQKTMEQLPDADGKLTDVVEYRVTVNPTALDLDPTSEFLELTDTLTVSNNADAFLNLQNVKLCKYDVTQDNGCGEEVETTRYQLTYDSKTHTMKVRLPDEFACVLVYRYTVDTTTVAAPTLSNRVDLNGEWKTSNESKLEDTTSSATASKSIFTIYKVDSEDYTKLLPGVKFKLESIDNSNGSGTWEEVGEYTTGVDGTLVFYAAGESALLKAGRLYRLTETKPLEGYAKADPYYFIIKEEGDTDWDAYTSIGANWLTNPTLSQNDIYFYGPSGGSLYVPNEYTRIAVQKVWINADEDVITPDVDSIDVELYRVTEKAKGYTVTVKSGDSDQPYLTINEGSVTVKEGSSLTLTFTQGGIQYITLNFSDGRESQELTASSGSYTYTIDSVTNDLTITATSDEDSKIWFNTLPVFSNYEEEYELAEKTKIGETVTLSAEKTSAWYHSWDNLPKNDSNGNPYYYIVEETVPAGYTVSYTNNEGIQTGEIVITNKKERVFELPESGGPGTKLIYLSAAMLLLLSGGMLFLKQRQAVRLAAIKRSRRRYSTTDQIRRRKDNW